MINHSFDALFAYLPVVLSKLVPLVKFNVVAAAVIAPLSVVDAPDLTPLIVTLLLVAYIWWSICLTFRTVLPSSINIEFAAKVLVGRVEFCRVNVPVALAVNFAVLSLNFKSSKNVGAHVVLLLDLNKTPAWGCSDIVLVPPTSVSPIRATQSLYWVAYDKTAIQYSTPGIKYTGDGNVNVVAVAPVAEVLTSAGSLITWPKGSILGPG